MTDKRVLSVGQCMADHGSISRTIHSQFSAQVVSCDSSARALTLLRRESFALVLVNRVLDADGSSGMDLIQAIKEDPALASVPVMLVSNYADAQEQAVAAGAIEGFGKSALSQPVVRERLQPYLG